MSVKLFKSLPKDSKKGLKNYSGVLKTIRNLVKYGLIPSPLPSGGVYASPNYYILLRL